MAYSDFSYLHWLFHNAIVSKSWTTIVLRGKKFPRVISPVILLLEVLEARDLATEKWYIFVELCMGLSRSRNPLSNALSLVQFRWELSELLCFCVWGDFPRKVDTAGTGANFWKRQASKPLQNGPTPIQFRWQLSKLLCFFVFGVILRACQVDNGIIWRYWLRNSTLTTYGYYSLKDDIIFSSSTSPNWALHYFRLASECRRATLLSRRRFLFIFRDV